MPEAPVVSNTSPLITLAGVGLLALLPQLYGAIWILEVVQDEYVAHQEPPDIDIRSLWWLSVHPIATDPTLHTLSGFGAGEAAAISLAQACHARLVIVDDKRARPVARERGLVLVGTLGVLVVRGSKAPFSQYVPCSMR